MDASVEAVSMGQDLYWSEPDTGKALSIWDSGMDTTAREEVGRGECTPNGCEQPQQPQPHMVGLEEWTEMVRMMDTLDENESVQPPDNVDVGSDSTSCTDEDEDEDGDDYALYTPVKVAMKTCTKKGVIRDKYWLYCENNQKNWVVPYMDFSEIYKRDERFVQHHNGQWLFAAWDLQRHVTTGQPDSSTEECTHVPTRAVLHAGKLHVSTAPGSCMKSELHVPAIGKWRIAIEVSTFENDTMMHPKQGLPECVQVRDVELATVPHTKSPLGFTCGFKITGRQQGWFTFKFSLFFDEVLFATSDMAPVMLNNPRISKKPLRNYPTWKVWLMNTYISIVGTRPVLDPVEAARIRSALAREVCMRRGSLEDIQDIIANSRLAMPRPRARKPKSP